jgi:hypothetical protein
LCFIQIAHDIVDSAFGIRGEFINEPLPNQGRMNMIELIIMMKMMAYDHQVPPLEQ